MNKRTKKPFITPSTKYKQYRRDFLIQALQFRPKQPIDSEICITALYYMPTKRRVDITNLMNATHDLLQDAKIIADDSSKIVKSVDGSRVLYDKENPRVEIIISEYKGDSADDSCRKESNEKRKEKKQRETSSLDGIKQN